MSRPSPETRLDAPLKELERFVQLERDLLARPDGPDRLREARLEEAEGTPHRRLGIVLRRLLLLGTELRAELPDPAGFLEIAAAATTEVALLVTAGGSLAKPAAGDALDHLTGLWPTSRAVCSSRPPPTGTAPSQRGPPCRA